MAELDYVEPTQLICHGKHVCMMCASELVGRIIPMDVVDFVLAPYLEEEDEFTYDPESDEYAKQASYSWNKCDFIE